MLSVITPVYNSDRFIEACIQNVVEQACHEAEHIIVDGGSTDRTVEIILQYAQTYSHIRWISEKDRGQSDAINKGISMAQGQILGILNADDFYERNTLNRVLENFKTLPEPAFLVGNCNVWNDQDHLLYVNQPSRMSFLKILQDINQFPFNPSAYFYHKSLHQKIGLYNIDEHYVMDLDFVLKATRVAKVRYVNELFGNFRLICGTKTLEAKRSGEIEQRVQNVLMHHRQHLSVFEHLQLSLLSLSTRLRSGLHSLQPLQQ